MSTKPTISWGDASGRTCLEAMNQHDAGDPAADGEGDQDHEDEVRDADEQVDQPGDGVVEPPGRQRGRDAEHH
jgi:hypothetical protein